MAEHEEPLTEERIERRRDFVVMDVTLNGDPALISGVLNRFATVTQRRTGLSVEFSWEAVERIVTTKGGRFES